MEKYEYGKSCEKCFTKENTKPWVFIAQEAEDHYPYEGTHHFCPSCAKQFIEVFQWVTDCVYKLEELK